jgi:hypothetical protein
LVALRQSLLCAERWEVVGGVFARVLMVVMVDVVEKIEQLVMVIAVVVDNEDAVQVC